MIILYKQNQLEQLFIFTIYQSYTMALMIIIESIAKALTWDHNVSHIHGDITENVLVFTIVWSDGHMVSKDQPILLIFWHRLF